MITKSLRPFAPSSGRLKRLFNIIEQADPKVLSLDVFDTLLYRPFQNPPDLFAEVYEILKARLAREWNLGPTRFIQMRREAEREERMKHPRSEATLTGIAGKLSAILDREVSAEWIIDAEIAAEQRFIRLDRDIATLILRAREEGMLYILVSDMYLSREDILGLLRIAALRAGIELPEPAAVFVSGDHGTGKADQLFRIMIDSLGVEAGDILHIGDNPSSDVEASANLGMAYFHYERENPYLAAVLEKERALEEKSDFSLERTGGGFGLSTIRAKAFFSEGSGNHPRHFEYGAFVLGAPLTLFAEWIVEDSLQRRESTIFCLMREGEFLSSLINKVASCRGANVTARPLWTSRYAMKTASYRRVDGEEIRRYFKKKYIPSLRMAAKDLFLPVELLRSKTGIVHEHPMTMQERDRFIAALLSDERHRKQVLEASALHRARLLEYYRKEGVAGRDRVTLVDLGWAGSIQDDLLELLREEAGFSHIRGLYFATNEQILTKRASDSSFASFLYHQGGPMPSFWSLKRTPQILEQSCSCGKGSLQRIEEHGCPRLFPSIIPEKQIGDTKEIQRGVLRFAELWLEGGHSRESGMRHADKESMIADLRSILRRSLEDPEPEEAALFENWFHDDNDGSLEIERIFGSEQTRERAAEMTRREILALDWRDCFWPAGLSSLIGKIEGSESIDGDAGKKSTKSRGCSLLRKSFLRMISQIMHFLRCSRRDSTSNQ
ncbi:MAG: hypothetical protein ACOYOI_03955 [Chthoniobacterales bacterium]